MLVLNIGEIPDLLTIPKSIETSLDAADTECPRHVYQVFSQIYVFKNC
jgi:hypothetical protein